MNSVDRVAKAVIFAEVALCWLLALLGLAFATLNYLGSAEGPGMGWVGYVVATALVVTSALFYFAAGHLEESGRLMPVIHGLPVALLLLVFYLGRILA